LHRPVPSSHIGGDDLSVRCKIQKKAAELALSVHATRTRNRVEHGFELLVDLEDLTQVLRNTFTPNGTRRCCCPMIASAAMAFSSVTVALRLRRTRR